MSRFHPTPFQFLRGKISPGPICLSTQRECLIFSGPWIGLVKEAWALSRQGPCGSFESFNYCANTAALLQFSIHTHLHRAQLSLLRWRPTLLLSALCFLFFPCRAFEKSLLLHSTNCRGVRAVGNVQSCSVIWWILFPCLVWQNLSCLWRCAFIYFFN